ncbi:MAG TPA: zinc ribbon domain-containing protein [Bacteroidia bacterium]|jgi:hypothetical protein
MNYCPHCGTALEPASRFCSACGADLQPVESSAMQKSDPAGLTTLCILSLVGSIFGLFRSWIYASLSIAISHNEDWRTWGFIAMNLLTMTGAALMIARRMNGLYIYTAGQVGYLFLTLYTTFHISSEVHELSGLAIMLSMVFFLPALSFLILFWMPFSKQHLR